MFLHQGGGLCRKLIAPTGRIRVVRRYPLVVELRSGSRIGAKTNQIISRSINLVVVVVVGVARGSVVGRHGVYS